MLFCGSNDGGLIGKNARRMMMFLSITIDEEVQQTLSFFEKVQYVSCIFSNRSMPIPSCVYVTF